MPDAHDHNIRRGVYGSGLRGEGVVTLAHKDCGEFTPKRRFHRRQQVRLVVDHDIAIGRVALLHMVEYTLLVQINHDPALHRIPYSRALNLARLEHDVAVRQHHGAAESAQVGDGLEGSREQPCCERIFQQKFRHCQQVRMIVQSGAKYLQASQVVGKPQLFAQTAEDGPITRAFRGAESLCQAVAEICGKAIVVQQGVVHVQQKNRLPGVQHGEDLSVTGSCQVSPSFTISAEAPGPQVPGSYSSTGVPAVHTGSTTRQAASTLSSWVNSEVSPRMASPSRRS